MVDSSLLKNSCFHILAFKKSFNNKPPSHGFRVLEFNSAPKSKAIIEKCERTGQYQGSNQVFYVNLKICKVFVQGNDTMLIAKSR